MRVRYERCCGLDLHKKSVTACRLTPGPDGHAVPEIRTFGTMTGELLGLGDWLAAGGVTHVAMESTECTGSRFRPASCPRGQPANCAS